MARTKTYPYDVAEYLHTPEEMAAYLAACVEESQGDAVFVATAITDIERAARMRGIDPGRVREIIDSQSKRGE